MDVTEKRERLERIAQQDEIYHVWVSSYGEFTEKFHRFVKWCPKRVQNFLRGYAESGRLMMQRMVELACEHMQFPEG